MLPRLSTLVLDTADLPSGDINTNKTRAKFRNIDFDTLLGDDWREFDQFNLVLVSVVFDVNNSMPTTVVPEVRLSGPPFADPDLRGNVTLNDVTLCSVDLTSIQDKPYIENFHSTNAWTIKRDDENLFNFTLSLIDPLTGGTALGTFPRQLYIFKMYKI